MVKDFVKDVWFFDVVKVFVRLDKGCCWKGVVCEYVKESFEFD